MSQYSWPDPATQPLLGKRILRLDGPSKSSGRAKYTYDYNPDGLLAGKIVRCPYAHAKIKSIDTSAAEKMPGVKAIEIVQKPGTEIFWAGDEIVGVAAVDEGTAEDAVRAIKVEYEVLPHFVSDAEPPKNIAPTTGPISQDDFEAMEENQVPDDEVIAMIKKRGISFTADDKYLKAMEGEGTDPKVIAAVRNANSSAALRRQIALQTNRNAEAGRSRQGVCFCRGYVRGLVRRSVHRSCLSRVAWLGLGMERQRPDGAYLDPKLIGHCGTNGRAAEYAGCQHPSVAAERWRWLWQQVCRSIAGTWSPPSCPSQPAASR